MPVAPEPPCRSCPRVGKPGPGENGLPQGWVRLLQPSRKTPQLFQSRRVRNAGSLVPDILEQTFDPRLLTFRAESRSWMRYPLPTSVTPAHSRNSPKDFRDDGSQNDAAGPEHRAMARLKTAPCYRETSRA